MPGRPRRTRSKLPLLHSCPGGVRKSTLHGPWQILFHHKALRSTRQGLFAWHFLSGCVSLFGRLCFLPLLHTLVEARVGERRLRFMGRRLSSRFGIQCRSLCPSLRREPHPKMSNDCCKQLDAPLRVFVKRKSLQKPGVRPRFASVLPTVSEYESIRNENKTRKQKGADPHSSCF